MVDHNRVNELNHALELLHFGFRTVTERPDALLAQHGLHRVHHRVLYFVGRNPGANIGELLVILGVTKQALNKPLRELIDGGWIDTSSPVGNRRIKQLRLSERGAALEEALSGDQRQRFARVFASVGREAEVSWREVMRRLAERQ
ncbi:MAG: MarR family winged helix-turn-helix transcriptional regulator [Dehalococcoidia bacterium]